MFFFFHVFFVEVLKIVVTFWFLMPTVHFLANFFKWKSGVKPNQIDTQWIAKISFIWIHISFILLLYNLAKVA